MKSSVTPTTLSENLKLRDSYRQIIEDIAGIRGTLKHFQCEKYNIGKREREKKRKEPYVKKSDPTYNMRHIGERIRRLFTLR